MRWPSFPGWTRVRDVRRAYVRGFDCNEADLWDPAKRPPGRGWVAECVHHRDGTTEASWQLLGRGDAVNGGDYRMRVG